MKLTNCAPAGKQQGFTLIEALIAMVVLTIGILAVYSMQITAINGNAKASQMTQAANVGQEQVEGLIQISYDLVTDNQTQEQVDNGEIETGPDVSGLYNPYLPPDDDKYLEEPRSLTTRPPDDISTNGIYTIYTNVVEDEDKLIKGCKMIQYLVVREGSDVWAENPPIIFRYIKEGPI